MRPPLRDTVGAMTIGRPSEDDLIARYFAPIAGEGGLALVDDAALLMPTPGHDLVLTTDAIVAGVHFFPDDPSGSIGRKALGVNISDLAAKGALPVGYLLTLALPADWTESWLGGFTDGLATASRDFCCPLLGGDTVRASGALTLGVTALGETPSGRMVRRDAARVGDRLCVTGTIGDAALGLALRLEPEAPWTRALAPDQRAFLCDRYLHPRPRLPLATIVREHARAAMDVSDGLAGDLAKMMRAAGLSAEVDLPLVPISSASREALAADPRLLERLVTGGDDYEILCAVPEASLAPFLDACSAAGVPASPIGSVVEGNALPAFRDGAIERRFARGSFSHF